MTPGKSSRKGGETSVDDDYIDDEFDVEDSNPQIVNNMNEKQVFPRRATADIDASVSNSLLPPLAGGRNNA